MAVRVDANAQ